MPAYEQAVGIVRPGGVISRVGVPQYEEAPVGFGSLFGPNVTLTGGPAPVRAYIERLLPGVLDGTVEPGQGLRPHHRPRGRRRGVRRHGRAARRSRSWSARDLRIVTSTILQETAVLDTGVRGGPEPEAITLETFGREIAEA